MLNWCTHVSTLVLAPKLLKCTIYYYSLAVLCTFCAELVHGFVNISPDHKAPEVHNLLLFLSSTVHPQLVHGCVNISPGPKVIRLFSCSTQLSTKFRLLIKTKIPVNKNVFCCMSLRCCIYHDDNNQQLLAIN